MQLSAVPIFAHAHSIPAQPHDRPSSGWIRRRARSRSYLQGYASRRRAPRFRIR